MAQKFLPCLTYPTPPPLPHMEQGNIPLPPFWNLKIKPWEEELQQQDISFYEGLDKYIQSLKLIFMDIKLLLVYPNSILNHDPTHVSLQIHQHQLAGLAPL